MTTDAVLDNHYHALQDQAAALRRAFVAALARLEALSDDFGSGSQQRFMQYMRACADLREQGWEVQQQIDKLDRVKGRAGEPDGVLHRSP